MGVPGLKIWLLLMAISDGAFLEDRASVPEQGVQSYDRHLVNLGLPYYCGHTNQNSHCPKKKSGIPRHTTAQATLKGLGASHAPFGRSLKSLKSSSTDAEKRLKLVEVGGRRCWPPPYRTQAPRETNARRSNYYHRVALSSLTNSIRSCLEA